MRGSLCPLCFALAYPLQQNKPPLSFSCERTPRRIVIHPRRRRIHSLRTSKLKWSAVQPSATETVIEHVKEQDGIVLRWYRKVPVEARATRVWGEPAGRVKVEQEDCYNVLVRGRLEEQEWRVLRWLLAETFDQDGLREGSWFEGTRRYGFVVEVGPRLNFQTAWSANAVAICNACGITKVERLERSRRYLVMGVEGRKSAFVEAVCDRMTEVVYDNPLETFDSGILPEKTYLVPLLTKGVEALRDINVKKGLGFDEWDIQYYMQLFAEMGRNPTNVELFDLAQSNSEHSRHWFFKGKLILNGVPIREKHLFDIVRQPLKAHPSNSVIAFADNSSSIRGGSIPTLIPTHAGQPSPFAVVERDRDVSFTAETHNFPSGVAPFPGAETGTGGRLRDIAATGIGSLVIAGTAGYAVGALPSSVTPTLPNQAAFRYPNNLASPLKILLDASSGASDYGNKFGEPVINGFARSYGMLDADGTRREYLKPIMFSGGIGQLEHSHSRKAPPAPSLLVIKLGGPAYRIGCGGGAASSMVSGDNCPELDFNAVQRGDAEMESKAYRVIRACVELGESNPIVSIHDQGAGGNCNVVKELIYPSGAKINLREIWIGDKTLSALEIWGAEYQEQFGMLIAPENKELVWDLCAREHVEPRVLGVVDGSGKIVLYDELEDTNVVDLELESVLGDLPQKTFHDSRVPRALIPLRISEELSIRENLKSVLRLMTVGSKRFLTTKVDRSVSGLVALQPTVGPLQLPLSDAAVVARSHFSLKGGATAVGERPTLTHLSPAAMARMTLGEMLTNICCVKITALEHIKCEGNWMWAAKMPGEAAAMYDAAIALRDAMISLGIAIDGGKDSLSMAARCPKRNGEFYTVKAPGTLVMSAYATADNITVKSTPDLKRPGESVILHVDIADGCRRLGGSSFAYTQGQLGNQCPDVDVNMLREAFTVTQRFIGNEVLSYHDISDGGLLVSLLEMAFSGNCGLDIFIDSDVGCSVSEAMFSEELGMLLEVSKENQESLIAEYKARGIPCKVLALPRKDCTVSIVRNDSGSSEIVLREDMRTLRNLWEETSFALDALQANPGCVESEKWGLSSRKGLSYHLPHKLKSMLRSTISPSSKHKVAIIREEGSNGDREMAVAFTLAGFEAWDVSMSDLLSHRIHLDQFRGVAFVGGFSYADVLDSAKGWSGLMKFREDVKREFEKFYAREDTFSLGVCNGCQLMALLGVIPFSSSELDDSKQPRFIRNESERFESRFLNVTVGPTNSIMLKNMEGAKLGVWCSHAEGRAFFPDKSILSKVQAKNLAPIRYVDDDGVATTTYPFNPNGSDDGIAALCSSDGRHLGMMPHPERCVLKWQWPYLPEELDKQWEISPWLVMFQNAKRWCEENPE